MEKTIKSEVSLLGYYKAPKKALGRSVWAASLPWQFTMRQCGDVPRVTSPLLNVSHLSLSKLHIHTNSLCCYHKDWVTGRTGFDVEREIPDLSVRGDETDRFYRSQRIFNVCNSHEWLIIKRGGGLRDEQSLFIFPLWSDYGFYLNLIIHNHYSNCEPSIPSLCGGK